MRVDICLRLIFLPLAIIKIITYQQVSTFKKAIKAGKKGTSPTVFGIIELHKKNYKGEDISLMSIYDINNKKRGRLKYLLSAIVEVAKDGKTIPAKVDIF